MERGFQALLLGGESSDDDRYSLAAFIGKTTADDACIKASYAAVDAQTSSFLTEDKYLLQSLGYGCGTLPVAPPVQPVACGYESYDVGEDWKLKVPKYETVDYELVRDVEPTEPLFDLISKSSGSVSGEFDSRLISQVPGMNSQTPSFLSVGDEKYLLQSLEKYGYGALPVADPSAVPLAYSYDVVEDWKLKFPYEKLRTPKYEPVDYELVNNAVSTEPPFDSRLGKLPSLLSLDSFGLTKSPKKRVRSLSPATSSTNYLAGPIPQQTELPPSTSAVMARSRRQRISERTRCLQKLLPWDKKMDQATMLEEAYKYVKFLQAQVSALQSMPVDSSVSDGSSPSNRVNAYGGLGRLNRQQLLQVMVNSPVVQTRLYSQGMCVYSVEQLVWLKKLAERKALLQQMGYYPSMIR